MDDNAHEVRTVQPTIDYTPSMGPGPPGVEVVAGSGDHLSKETWSRVMAPSRPGVPSSCFARACGALSEAHLAGLVHRDLKPANIFAARRGHLYDFVKLLDFGLVLPPPEAPTVESSREGQIAGSPQYMAPEQASGRGPLDARTDLYGLGGVAYFLLTGRPPFDCDSALQLVLAHACDPVTPPSRLRPDLPADLEAVVMRCLEKEPARRFADTGELARALSGCN